MPKRLPPSTWSSSDPGSSPSERDSVYGEHMTKRPRYPSDKDTRRRPTTVLTSKHTMPTELLQFILDHEEAFKSRGRLASLYSDFRSQISTNPDGYNANISAWKKALAEAARAGAIPTHGTTHDLLSIRTGDDLVRELQHSEFGRPTCLPAVFYDAVAKKEMMPLRDFLDSQRSIYQSSWIPSPRSVVEWGLRQMGVLGPPGSGDKLKSGSFVVLKNVETAADDILKRIRSTSSSSVDLIFSRSEFLERFSHVLNSESEKPLTSNDLNILLTYLMRDKQAISYNSQTIKFRSETDPMPLPVTQEDSAIVNLRETLAKIQAQLPILEQKVQGADVTAKEAVRTKQMVRAKAALRSKKLAESAYSQRVDVALQLEGVYAQLQQAADQVEIVAAMKAGGAALKGLNQKVGGVDGVEAVVEALKEEMQTAEDINNIINESGEPVDEGEIDEEFEALEKAEKKAREEEEAAKTAARLAELEHAEMERKEKEAATALVEREARATAGETERKEKDDDDKIEHAAQDFARLSVHEDMPPAEGRDEKEGVPLPA